MKTSALTGKERVQLALAHQETDRIPKAESFWKETLPLWYEQGMPRDVDVHDFFNYDIMRAGWINHRADPGVSVVVEETDEWESRRDGNGTILRYWKGRSGTPEHVGFTVDTPEKWRELKKTLLAVHPSARVNLEAARETMARARAAGRWLCWGGVEAFEIVKDVVGHENLCVAMAEEPEWAQDMFETETQVALSVLDYLAAEGIEFDGAWMYGDVAYNHGPFFSPRMYRQMLMPSHRIHMDWFKKRNLPVIYHTDGDFRPLIPSLLELGVDCFQPLEAKAGIDVRELKPLHGDKVAFMGNIDIMVLITNDRAKVEAEISSKIPMAKKGGGYIYHSDHSIAPGVRFETYQYVMELVEKYGAF
jgi:uroporphyrinogen decarboxylase